MKRHAEIRVGDTASVTRVVTADMVAAFAELSGDRNPLHLDEDFACRMRWGRRLAHGALTSAFVSAALTELSAGWVYLGQSSTFVRPVFLDESVTAQVTVTEKQPRRRMVVRTEVLCGTDVVAHGEAVLQELTEAFGAE
jgi:3-hydroxybutyryl-CoA dehydratase